MKIAGNRFSKLFLYAMRIFFHGFRPLVFLGIGLFFIASCTIQNSGSAGSQKQAPPAAIQPGGIAWVYSLGEGLALAAAEKKPVMIDLYAGWCYYCKKLDKEVYSDPHIQELASKFVSIKIDGDKTPEVAMRFKVQGYPTIVFLNPAGQTVNTIADFRPKEAFNSAMQQALLSK